MKDTLVWFCPPLKVIRKQKYMITKVYKIYHALNQISIYLITVPL